MSNNVFRIFVEYGPGSILGRFGLQIRILREKLYIAIGSDQFFVDFWKSDFSKNQFFAYKPILECLNHAFDHLEL